MEAFVKRNRPYFGVRGGDSPNEMEIENENPNSSVVQPRQQPTIIKSEFKLPSTLADDDSYKELSEAVKALMVSRGNPPTPQQLHDIVVSYINCDNDVPCHADE